MIDNCTKLKCEIRNNDINRQEAVINATTHIGLSMIAIDVYSYSISSSCMPVFLNVSEGYSERQNAHNGWYEHMKLPRKQPRFYTMKTAGF